MDKKWVIVNVEGAIYKEDKWLMIKRGQGESHAPGRIALVGGKVEEAAEFEISMHILERTLKREIKEEVGIEVEDKMSYIVSTSFISDSGNPVVNVVFLCKYKSGDARVQDPNEIEEVYWMTLDEIIKEPKTISNIKEILKIAVEKRLSGFL